MFPAGLLFFVHNSRNELAVMAIEQFLFTSCSLANEGEWASASHVIPLVPVSTELSTIFVAAPIVWFTPIPVGVRCGWPVTPLECPFDSFVVESNPKVFAGVFSDLRCDERLFLRVIDAHQVRRHSQASGTRIVPVLLVRCLQFVARSAIRCPAIWAAWHWHGKLANYVRTKKPTTTKQPTPIRWTTLICPSGEAGPPDKDNLENRRQAGFPAKRLRKFICNVRNKWMEEVNGSFKRAYSSSPHVNTNIPHDKWTMWFRKNVIKDWKGLMECIVIADKRDF